eukprot:m.298809 g.298809  ORF g.298809 m.298809 type:complete len:365 (+) comp15865_c2_seq3:1763-2857(+)
MQLKRGSIVKEKVLRRLAERGLLMDLRRRVSECEQLSQATKTLVYETVLDSVERTSAAQFDNSEFVLAVQQGLEMLSVVLRAIDPAASYGDGIEGMDHQLFVQIQHTLQELGDSDAALRIASMGAGETFRFSELDKLQNQASVKLFALVAQRITHFDDISVREMRTTRDTITVRAPTSDAGAVFMAYTLWRFGQNLRQITIGGATLELAKIKAAELKTLSLEGTGVSAPVLLTLLHLTKLYNLILPDGLNLWSNGIGDEGAAILGDLLMLPNAVDIGWIGLGNNGIGLHGCQRLAPAFAAHPKLCFVDFRDNPIWGEPSPEDSVRTLTESLPLGFRLTIGSTKNNSATDIIKGQEQAQQHVSKS